MQEYKFKPYTFQDYLKGKGAILRSDPEKRYAVVGSTGSDVTESIQYGVKEVISEKDLSDDDTSNVKIVSSDELWLEPVLTLHKGTPNPTPIYNGDEVRLLGAPDVQDVRIFIKDKFGSTSCMYTVIVAYNKKGYVTTIEQRVSGEMLLGVDECRISERGQHKESPLVTVLTELQVTESKLNEEKIKLRQTIDTYEFVKSVLDDAQEQLSKD